ncbi:MAG: biotin--[acetyl-CoA-carboxylase] ligase [Eubacteriales bacterium]|nr:biotin--[acetyl-CoA-carboxylase] ligase [Eubacteriales bacterium]
MTVKDQIIIILNENRGEYISGEQLAERLQVSRAAVWKAINRLKEDGFTIEGINKKGYRLAEDTDVLSAQGVQSYLTNSDAFRVEVYKTVTSTNLLLKERANEEEGLVIAASEQTDGMGRLGRKFVSPADTGIYFSILLKPTMDNKEVTLLTTIAAVAVCEAIEKYTSKQPKIKWVNDVFLDNRKVCGILTQASFSMENMKPEYVVVGIGINLYHPRDGFGAELRNIAGTVLNEQSGDIKNKILAEVLNRYYYYYTNFEKREFISSYKERSFVLGKQIMVVTPNNMRPAKALDIDEECHLLVSYEDGSEEWLSTGEISIRLPKSDD